MSWAGKWASHLLSEARSVDALLFVSLVIDCCLFLGQRYILSYPIAEFVVFADFFEFLFA